MTPPKKPSTRYAEWLALKQPGPFAEWVAGLPVVLPRVDVVGVPWKGP